MARPPLPLGAWGGTFVEPVRGKDGTVRRYRARVRYRDFDGRVRFVERSARSATAARSALRTALQQRSLAAGTAELGPMDTFEKASDLWLGRLRRLVHEGHRSPGTLETYERQMTVHILPALGALRLREITPRLLDRFIGHVREDVGAASARSCRSVVSGILGMAVRYGAIPSNPTRDVDRVEGKLRREPRALTQTDRLEWFRRLREGQRAVDLELVDLTLFLLGTGLRLGEALAVLWSEVDLDTCSVHVTSTLLRVTGEGLIRKTTKSNAGQRTLLLPTWTVDMLQVRWARGARLDMPVLHNLDGGFRDPSNTRRELRQAAQRIGFPWVTPHVFRKTCATILDDAGLSARMIADQLGHSRPSMTQDVYMGRKAPHEMVVRALDLASPNPVEFQRAAR